MTFLAPLFLVGLAGLAVPVIIHLVHRQKPHGVPFPSLMFLQRIPYKAQRRQRIRHLLIFLLRCAAVALIVLAFARPLFRQSPEVLARLGGGRDVVILLDRSYSMRYADRWDRAVAAVENAIAGLSPDDRVALVAFDADASALTELTGDAAVVRAALRQVTPGDGVTRFAPATKLAQSLLDGGDRQRQHVVFVSDFQRRGWNPDELVPFLDRVTVTPVDVAGGREVANVAVATVTARQDPRGEREDVQVSARIVNTGPETVDDLSVAFVMNGQEIESQTISLGGESAQQVVFAEALLPVEPARAEIRITPDALPLDDTFRFVLSPGQAVNVLLLEGGSRRSNQSLYLTRALGVGTDPPYRIRTQSVNRLTDQDLETGPVVILNDAAPNAATASRLRSFVAEGGSVWLAFGPNAGTGGAMGDLLPGVPGRRVEPRSARGGTITFLDYGHPAFEAFAAPRSGDFSRARVFRYRALAVTPDDSTRVLARFDDGGTAVAERRIGEGRVVVFASTLDAYWSDLALQPVYVPFVHQLTRYLAGWGRTPRAFPVEGVADIAAYADRYPGGEAVAALLADGAGELTLVGPQGDRTRRPAAEGGLIRLVRAGFYEIEPADDTGNAIVVAVNVDVTESDLTPLDQAEFLAALAPGTSGSGGGDPTLEVTPEEQERQQAVWWYLLVTAILILGAETLLSNRVSRAAR